MPRKQTSVNKESVTAAETKAAEAIIETAEETVEETTVETAAVEKPAVKTKAAAKKTVKKYAPDDVIFCRSIFAGTLYHVGMKTKIPYMWSRAGDVCGMEYQDLSAAMLARRGLVMNPDIIIEDEELLDMPRWEAVKDLYTHIYSDRELEKIIALPTARFREVFTDLPKGFKQSITTMVRTRLENGTFDSLNKIRVIDEVCGTDLRLATSE